MSITRESMLPYVYDVDLGDTSNMKVGENTITGTQRIISIQPPEVTNTAGIRIASVLGIAADPTADVGPRNFTQSNTFLEIIHQFASTAADPILIEAASTLDKPTIAMVDDRALSTPGIRSDNTDIIGHYTVEDGKVTNYRPNPTYKVWNARGVGQLTPWLRTQLAEAIETPEVQA